MSSYLEVSSNDTLNHRALNKSPATLCGKPVVSILRPEQIPDLAVTTGNPLVCDICETLTGGDSLLKETNKTVEAGRDCPYCEDGVDGSGLSCWNCGGTGWLDEGDSDDYLGLEELNPEQPIRGTKVGSEEFNEPFERVELKVDEPNLEDLSEGFRTSQVKDKNNQVSHGWEAPCPECGEQKYHQRGCPQGNAAPYDQTHQQEKTDEIERLRTAEKTATNWTRDGVPIEDGFTVITIDKEQAARTPFLDITRVSVSEKRECPDCGERQWLSKISSCSNCDGLKCNSCMDSIGMDTFFGMCKKCASPGSAHSYDSGYEDSLPEQGRFLSYLMQDDDTEIDSLFLPNSD